MTIPQEAGEAARKIGELVSEARETDWRLQPGWGRYEQIINDTINSAVERKTKEKDAEIKRLNGQLPDGMKDCTIVFEKCSVGHGRLTATNWIDNGCTHCEIERLKSASVAPYAELEALKRKVGRMNATIEGLSRCEMALKESRKPSEVWMQAATDMVNGYQEAHPTEHIDSACANAHQKLEHALLKFTMDKDYEQVAAIATVLDTGTIRLPNGQVFSLCGYAGEEEEESAPEEKDESYILLAGIRLKVLPKFRDAVQYCAGRIAAAFLGERQKVCRPPPEMIRAIDATIEKTKDFHDQNKYNTRSKELSAFFNKTLAAEYAARRALNDF